MNDHSHSLVLSQANTILHNDGHQTFSYVANAYQTDLLRGLAFADSAGVPCYIDVDLHFVLAFGQSIKTWRVDLSNTASFAHYHDPQTDCGLDLSAYGDLETLVEAGAAAGAVLLGAAGFWLDVSAHPPLCFTTPYESAADAAQAHYDQALRIWRGQEEGETGYAFADAMFHLGWACHFFGDLCTSAHTTSSRFLDHQGYEDTIDAVQDNHAPHTDRISNVLAQYHLGASVRQLAVEAASETAAELPLYDAGQWDQAARLAIPRAERYTARILAKFFLEAGVSTLPRPLTIHVRTVDESPIPNAVVFYRAIGKKWRVLIADATGTAHLVMKADEVLQFRPSMPGYAFEGNYGGNAPTIPEFPLPVSPVAYHQAADPFHTPSIVFRLRPNVIAPDTAIRRLAPQAGAMLLQAIRADAAVRRHRVSAATGSLADGIARAMTDQVEITLTGETPDTEPELEAGSATPAGIRVRVFNLLNLMTGALLRSETELRSLAEPLERPTTDERLAAFRNTRQAIRRGETGRAVELTPEAAEALTRTSESLDEPYAGQTPALKRSLPGRIPAMFVLARDQHRVTAEIVADAGYVGYGCEPLPPLEVMTNAYEEAWIRVVPGNQAGMLRVKVVVSPTRAQQGAGLFDVITKYVDLWVMPSDDGGPDASPIQPPRLERM